MRWFHFLSITLVVLTALSCSAGGSSPTSGDLASPADMTAATAPATGSNTVPWGFYDVAINTETGEADVVPLRGAVYTVDVVNFLQYPMGNPANLQIQITDTTNWLTDGEMTIEVRLTHPFPGLGQYTGHDVKGVLVSPGSLNGLYDSEVAYSNGVDEVVLLNPDGYTRWHNPVEFVPDGTFFNFIPGWLGNQDISNFTATINGYKYFGDSLDADQSVQEYFQNPNNIVSRGQFTPSSVNLREYQLRFPMEDDTPVVLFQYAVVAHWVEPDNYDPGDLPGSFPQSANADEAFNIEVTDNSTLWYHDGSGGGQIILDIEVFDWGVVGNPSGVLDEIGAIIVECHDLLIPGGYTVFDNDFLAANSQPGSCDNSVLCSITQDAYPESLASPKYLVTVESKYPTEFDQGLGDPPTDANLAGYFFFQGAAISPQAPYADPVTDLSLLVIRVDSGTAIESIELHWTDTNAEEYAVYWDEDPYDGINPDYSTAVAEVEGSPAVITDFDRNAEYVFTVRARAVAGDPLSELEDSNYAFIDMDNGGSGTDPGNWHMGGNSTYTGRMRMQRGAGFGNGGWGYFVDNGLWANACMDMWSSLSTPQIPEIDGATEAFVEWAHWYYDCWKAATFPSCNYPDNYPGFVGGGATAQAPEPITGYDYHKWFEFDIFYDDPDDPPGGLEDPATHIGYDNPTITFFFGTPTVSAIWHGTDENWRVSRVNAGLADEDFDYGAVTCATHSSLNSWYYGEGHYYMDDLAVVVY